MVSIIAGREEIGKFFYQYGLGEKLSGVPQERLAEIICGMAMKGNQSKTTDFAEKKQRFRTTYGHLLSKGKWDERAVSRQQQEVSLQKITELALEKDIPVYLSISGQYVQNGCSCDPRNG